MEGNDDVRPNAAQSQSDVCSAEAGGGEVPGKVEDEGNPFTADACDSRMVKGGVISNHVDDASPSVVGPAAESPGGVALKVATTVLHPVCLGDSPSMSPIHLQMAGAAAPQLGQIGAAPFLIAGQSPVSLPSVSDQQVLKHMSPSIIPQTTASCAQSPLQNNVSCQNPSAFGLPPAIDPKAAGQAQEANSSSLLQNPAFAAISQDLFPPQAGSSTCQSPGSAFFPLPPLTPPYASPLAPSVPPATLLVPYPVIIPSPVPSPVPLPIPIPVAQSEDSKGSMPKPVCTVSKSTQTSPGDTNAPSLSQGRCTPHSQPRNVSPSSPSVEQGHASDLSVKACPIEPKQEYPSPHQDNVLDSSVPGIRKKCTQTERRVGLESGQGATSTALSSGVECTPTLDSKLSGSSTSSEFSRQHKWSVDTGVAGSSSSVQDASLSGAGNSEIVSTSQTAKVIVSVKDAIPAILCGKIKGLSGVSTKNFSIKRDGSQAASSQQLYGMSSASHGEQDPNNPHKKITKNRAIKLKKVSSQEIHFLPIKKQRLAALSPRK